MEMQSGYVLEKYRIGRVRRWLLRERNLMICFFAKKQKVLVDLVNFSDSFDL